MSSRRLAPLAFLLTLASIAGFASGEPAAPSAAPKLGTQAAQLLLPLYVVNTEDLVAGTTTLYAIRNESAAQTVDVEVRYFEAGEPDTPQLSETVTLGPKATDTFDVRSRLAGLQVDNDGFARGYITFATATGAATIHGDYFHLNGGQNFASGYRLLDVDPESRSNDLCTRFSMRFLDSALVFDSGTVFTVWFEPDDPPGTLAFSYTVYDLAGNVVLSSSFNSDKFAFEITANDLLGPFGVEFGAIEFDFDTVGHISAVMSAFDRFSVGFEATCLDAS